MRVLRALLALAIAAFLLFSPRFLLEGLSQDYTHGIFELEEPEWEGIIELWHIVDFKAYQGSVTRYLAARTEAFCKAHPGVFIEVTGMTVEAFAERYARGGSCCRCDKRRGRRRAVQRAAGKSPRSGSPLDLSNKRCGASRAAIHI